MIDSVRAWFSALSQREKILITVLLILLAGFIVFYGIIRPFTAAMDNAETRYQQSIEQQARINSKVAFFDEAKEAKEGDVKPVSGSIQALVSQSAGEAGFATSAINSQNDGSVTMAIDSTKPTAFFRWIATLEQRGIMVSEISANLGSNDTITATLQLR